MCFFVYLRSTVYLLSSATRLFLVMVKIEIEHTGGLHSEAVHVQSGTRLQTDAPLDNGGRGESFSPTDLVATALGTCMTTTMDLTRNETGSTSTAPRLSS